MVGMAHTTVISAIDRGELKAYTTACGTTRLLLKAELERWAADAPNRRPGRKPKPGKS